jgi:hypothetical protein
VIDALPSSVSSRYGKRSIYHTLPIIM